MIDSKQINSDELAKIDFAANIHFEYINDGQILLIHDVPIAREMVQQYSDGFHYKTPEAIDGINVEFSPVSISHPNKHFKQMSEVEQLDRTIGYMTNGYTKDNKKYTDLMMFVDKTPKEFIEKVEKQESTDVSIGFYHEIDETPGDFNGDHYDRKQVRIDLDHLAILPNEVGRASFPDGVGVGADITNNEVNKIAETNELKDALKDSVKLSQELTDAKVKLSEQDKAIADKDAKIVELEKAVDEKGVKDLTEKADKYDASVKSADEAEVAKCDELKTEILKVRNDEKTKEFIDKMDSKQLEFVLGESKATGKPLPGKGTDTSAQGQSSMKEKADKDYAERYEKKTGSKLI